MRIGLLLVIPAVAWAQAPLIGVNSATAELKPGSRDSVAIITVDPSPSGGDLLAVMLTAEGVAIQIELPDGRRITKETAAPAGFQWELAAQGQGDAFLFPGLQGKVNHILILPPNAPKGKYKIHADAHDLKENAALTVEFLPLGAIAGGATGGRDTVRVAVTTPKTFHYAGERVEILAGVFQGRRGVSDARLTAVAVEVDENGMPKGKRMPVTFRPSAPDAAGSYTAVLPTTAAGKYDVAVKVQGKYGDGTEFERSAGTEIQIEPRRAEILSLSERPVDEDGNGLIDRIEVTAHVRVELAGQYSLSVDLLAPKGKYMQGYGKAQLGVGDGEITAVFGRYELTHVGADGPYEMSARLHRQEGNLQAFAALLDNHTRTRAYQESSFDRGALYFENVAAKPESPSGRAPFDKLKVTLDVFTPGGPCQWNGGLSSGRTDIQFVSDFATLPKGRTQIALTFDGDKILDAADGKPLEVDRVGITCGAVEGLMEKHTALQPFLAGTFARAAPGFQINFTPIVFMGRGQKSSWPFQIETHGGIHDGIEVSVEGLPAGITAEDLPRSIAMPNPQALVSFALKASPELPEGKYPVTLRLKHGSTQGEWKFTIFAK